MYAHAAIRIGVCGCLAHDAAGAARFLAVETAFWEKSARYISSTREYCIKHKNKGTKITDE